MLGAIEPYSALMQRIAERVVYVRAVYCGFRAT